MSRSLSTIDTKAQSIRTRNNQIERLVSSLSGPPQPGDSVLIREVTPERHREIWVEAMELLGEQFSAIQELIGMTR